MPLDLERRTSAANNRWASTSASASSRSSSGGPTDRSTRRFTGRPSWPRPSSGASPEPPRARGRRYRPRLPALDPPPPAMRSDERLDQGLVTMRLGRRCLRPSDVMISASLATRDTLFLASEAAETARNLNLRGHSSEPRASDSAHFGPLCFPVGPLPLTQTEPSPFWYGLQNVLA